MDIAQIERVWHDKTLDNHCDKLSCELDEELYFDQLSHYAQRAYLRSNGISNAEIKTMLANGDHTPIYRK